MAIITNEFLFCSIIIYFLRSKTKNH
jgi:hypothetical protein